MEHKKFSNKPTLWQAIVIVLVNATGIFIYVVTASKTFRLDLVGLFITSIIGFYLILIISGLLNRAITVWVGRPIKINNQIVIGYVVGLIASIAMQPWIFFGLSWSEVWNFCLYIFSK